jgi:hypothetical protein
MKLHYVLGGLAVCTLLTGSAPSAWAQNGGYAGAGGYFGGHSDNPVGPTVSPYLNLLNQGNQNSGIPTYQALVKPLEDQRQANLQQQADLQRLSHDVRQDKAAIRGTGTSTGGSRDYMHIRFQNYSHYYSITRH